MFDQPDEQQEKQPTEEIDANSPQFRPIFWVIIVLVVLVFFYTASHPDSILANLLRRHH
jgi:hypothetical protein